MLSPCLPRSSLGPVSQFLSPGSPGACWPSKDSPLRELGLLHPEPPVPRAGEGTLGWKARGSHLEGWAGRVLSILPAERGSQKSRVLLPSPSNCWLPRQVRNRNCLLSPRALPSASLPLIWGARLCCPSCWGLLGWAEGCRKPVCLGVPGLALARAPWGDHPRGQGLRLARSFRASTLSAAAS